jgi:hypothetical protein
VKSEAGAAEISPSVNVAFAIQIAASTRMMFSAVPKVDGVLPAAIVLFTK